MSAERNLAIIVFGVDALFGAVFALATHKLIVGLYIMVGLQVLAIVMYLAIKLSTLNSFSWLRSSGPSLKRTVADMERDACARTIRRDVERMTQLAEEQAWRERMKSGF